MLKNILFILVVFILRIIALSDIKVIQNVKIEKIDPGTGIRSIKNTEQIKWIKGKKIANINGDFTTIIDLSKMNKKDQFLFINNRKREFFKTNFPLYFSKLLPKELTAVRISQLPKLKVKHFNVEEKIGEYNCKTYRITLNFMMMMIKIKIWSSEEPFRENLIKSEKSSLSILNSNNLLNYFYPNLPEAANNKRSFYILRKIKGMQIKSEIEMDLLIKKIIITTELKNILYEDAPADIFSIPKNYKELTNFQN